MPKVNAAITSAINAEDVRQLCDQIRDLERQIRALRRCIDRALPVDENERYDRQFPLDTIYHIVPAGYYASLPGDQDYVPEPFAQEGFIHCTRGADLLALVANGHFQKVPGDFLMLVIDVPSVKAPIKYEALDPASPYPFPHIYGPLNRDAIVDVIKMRRAADGTFLVPTPSQA